MDSDIDDDFPLINRSAILVKPTAEFVAWLKTTPGDPSELTLEEIQEDSSVFLLPDELEDLRGWLKRNYMPIFEQELYNWCTEDSLWPKDLSFKSFKRFFQVSFYSMVYDLIPGSIEPESGDWDTENEEDLDGDDVDPEYREREMAKRKRRAEKDLRRFEYIKALGAGGQVIDRKLTFHADSLATVDDLAHDIAGRIRLLDPIVIEGEMGEGWDITFPYYALTNPNETWDTMENELRERKKTFTVIGIKYQCRLTAVDDVDIESIDDD